MSERNVRFWNIPVPAELDDRVECAVAADSHISKAELIRDAVRRFLDGMQNESKQK